jgi:hypothetical protein
MGRAEKRSGAIPSTGWEISLIHASRPYLLSNGYRGSFPGSNAAKYYPNHQIAEHMVEAYMVVRNVYNAHFPWYDTGHVENDVSNNYSIVECVFVTAVTFLPSRFLATIGGFLPSRCLATIRGFLPHHCRGNDKEIFTELLPSNDRGIHRYTHTDSNVIS